VINHGDIKPSNFLIDPNTLQITIIDFGDIAVLPRSFISYTLHSPWHRFIPRVTSFLSWERSKNLSAMVEASVIFFQLSGKELGIPHLCLMLDFELTMITGLNEDGHPMQTTASAPSPSA
jgi:serine/threonine protein kinase